MDRMKGGDKKSSFCAELSSSGDAQFRKFEPACIAGASVGHIAHYRMGYLEGDYDVHVFSDLHIV
jgi:hypothetical protein